MTACANESDSVAQDGSNESRGIEPSASSAPSDPGSEIESDRTII